MTVPGPTSLQQGRSSPTPSAMSEARGLISQANPPIDVRSHLPPARESSEPPIAGAEALSIEAISHFEELLSATGSSEGQLQAAYEALPEVLRHKIEELIYFHEAERRGSGTITDMQHGEHAVERSIEVLYPIKLEGRFAYPSDELSQLITLLRQQEKDAAGIRAAFIRLGSEEKNQIYGYVYEAHAIQNGRPLCPDREGELFGTHYTRENLSLLKAHSPLLGTTLWKAAIRDSALATAAAVNALQYRIPGRNILDPKTLRGLPSEDAARSFETVCFLLSTGGIVSPEIFTQTIIFAMDNDRFKDLRFLLSGDSPANKKYFQQALLLAINRARLDVTVFLLSEERFISQEDLGDAVNLAVQNGHLDIVRFLLTVHFPLSENRSISQNLLVAREIKHAAKNGHLDIVWFLLSEGRSISPDPLGWAVYQLGWAVESAAENGHLDIVRFLLSERRSITPHHLDLAVQYAAEKGHLEIVRFLLSESRSISQGALDRAVQDAAEKGHLDIVCFLLSEDRFISPDQLGNAVVPAAKNGHLDIVHFLLSEGRSISQGALDRAVQDAAENGHLEIVRFLLSEGRALSRYQRESLILWSSSNSRAALLEILLQSGPIRESVRNSARTQAMGEQRAQILDILAMAPVIRESAPASSSSASIPGTISGGVLYATLADVKARPEYYLQLIAKKAEGSSVLNESFPTRVVLVDNPRAVDLGGVTKEFISTLMGALLEKRSFPSTDTGFPMQQQEQDRDVYRSLGRCYALLDEKNAHRTDKFVTGPIFHPNFFKLVQKAGSSASDEAMRREAASLLKEANPAMGPCANVILDPTNEAVLATYAAAIGCHRNEALETAIGSIDEYVKAAEAFYEGATNSFQIKIRDTDPAILASSLQGAPVSKEGLLAVLTRKGDLSEELYGLVREKIEGSDEAWRIRFVKAITGNEVLSPGTKIQVGRCWRGGGSFEIHTCFNSIDIPTDVPQELLLQGLDAALGEGYNTA